MGAPFLHLLPGHISIIPAARLQTVCWERQLKAPHRNRSSSFVSPGTSWKRGASVPDGRTSAGSDPPVGLSCSRGSHVGFSGAGGGDPRNRWLRCNKCPLVDGWMMRRPDEPGKQKIRKNPANNTNLHDRLRLLRPLTFHLKTKRCFNAAQISKDFQQMTFRNINKKRPEQRTLRDPGPTPLEERGKMNLSFKNPTGT